MYGYPLLVGIIKDCRPHLVRVIFLQYPYIVFVVVVHIEIAGVELAVVQHYQDLLVALELTEVFSAAVVVEAQGHLGRTILSVRPMWNRRAVSGLSYEPGYG